MNIDKIQHPLKNLSLKDLLNEYQILYDDLLSYGQQNPSVENVDKVLR